MRQLLNLITVASLALGILPSLTALSSSIEAAVPSLAPYLGPINFLKVSAPILLLFCWVRRDRLPRPLLWFSVFLISTGSLFTFIAASRCQPHAFIYREWAVFVLGWIGALAFFALTASERLIVVTAWGISIYLTSILDIVLPGTIDWLYAHVFDPQTRVNDISELGHRALTGVFGRQSLAKLLAWLPWIWLAVLVDAPLVGRLKKPFFIALWIIILFSSAAILGTSQRGPFVAMLVAILVYGVHQGIRLKKWKVFRASLAGTCLAVLLTLALVPRAIWQPRMQSLLGLSDSASKNMPAEQSAEDNKHIRIQMNRFSAQIIAESPLGNACIPESRFREAELFPAHAHNMILEQFRSKGWIWGAIHLMLWVAAGLSAWRLKNTFGSALTAGIASILISGLVDHPWPVLNHSLLLSAFLLLALFGRQQNSKLLKSASAK